MKNNLTEALKDVKLHTLNAMQEMLHAELSEHTRHSLDVNFSALFEVAGSFLCLDKTITTTSMQILLAQWGLAWDRYTTPSAPKDVRFAVWDAASNGPASYGDSLMSATIEHMIRRIGV